MEDEILRLVNVWKKYGNTDYILKNINLTIRSGDFILISGKSGVGKTTLIKIMSLILTPTHGSVYVVDINASNLSDSKRSFLRRKYMGIVFQEYNLIPTLTVYENLELYMEIKGFSKSKARGQIMDLLKYFNLIKLANRYPMSLSMGERQRIAVIKALLAKPKIILADEPTANLDEENESLVLNLIKRINEEYKIAVVVTSVNHNLEAPFNRRYLIKNKTLYRVE